MVYALVALGLIVFWLAYSFAIEPRWLDVRRINLALPRWPAHLDGLRIALLSDPHFGALGSERIVKQAIKVADSEHFDMVILTGDYTVRGRHTEGCGRVLAQLGRRPVVAVLGNHDYKAGGDVADGITNSLSDLGFTVLRNESISVCTRLGAVRVAGLDDYCHDLADLTATLGRLPDDGSGLILLTHTPEGAADLPPDSVDLVLSGHTHGGQINLPVLTPLLIRLLYSRFIAGTYWHRGAAIYVNRGLGSVGIPARFRCRPEITLITLRSAIRVPLLLTPPTDTGILRVP